MRSPQLLSRGTTSINMTPMIDVVFLLIIFFLVSSHMAKQENMIQLNLPDAISGTEDASTRDTLVINVLPSGDWQTCGGQSDAEAVFAAMRRSAMAAEEPLRLKIRTDQFVTYSRIEPLLKMAAEAGIGDIVFSVYEAKTGGGSR
ncbi:MAG: biopolymer transporter ExbD [Pirellulaceae bacterium]